MASSSKIYQLYLELRQKYGEARKYWPGWCSRKKSRQLREEIAIGAILTQRTNWKNVEMALTNYRSCDFLSIEKIYKRGELRGQRGLRELGELIRPAGFYKQKARRLWEFCRMIMEDYSGLDKFMKEEVSVARQKLLSLWGIGPETADSILLYALDKPSFVIDEYTRRLVSRLSVFGDQLSDIGPSVVSSSVTGKPKTEKPKTENRKRKTDNRLLSYDYLKNLFEQNLPHHVHLYQDFHALIVVSEKGERGARMR